MGCAASVDGATKKNAAPKMASVKESPANEVKKGAKSGKNDDEGGGRSVRWKVVPTAEQARDKYEADGTLTKSSDAGHLELRQLLEEPIAQNYIGTYAREVKAQESFMCWVDVQEFKSIPTDDYRRSKGLHIYHKYVKPGAVLQLGGLDESEAETYREMLELSREDSKLITKDFFDKIQMKCFLEMYQNVYLRFKKSPK